MYLLSFLSSLSDLPHRNVLHDLFQRLFLSSESVCSHFVESDSEYRRTTIQVKPFNHNEPSSYYPSRTEYAFMACLDRAMLASRDSENQHLRRQFGVGVSDYVESPVLRVAQDRGPDGFSTHFGSMIFVSPTFSNSTSNCLVVS